MPYCSRSRDGWSPTAEAVSNGNRDLIAIVIRQREQQVRQSLQTGLAATFAALEAVRAVVDWWTKVVVRRLSMSCYNPSHGWVHRSCRIFA